jgi:hypothetical protein
MFPSHRFARLATFLFAVAAVCGGRAFAQTQLPTTTTLAVSVAGSVITTAPLYTKVTLTATVKNSSNALLPLGQVFFCNSTVVKCHIGNMLGSAWVVRVAGAKQGTASIITTFPVGSLSVKAFFQPTKGYAASSSVASTFSITKTATVPAVASLAYDSVTTGFEANGTVNVQLFGGVPAVAGAPAPTGAISLHDVTNGDVLLGTGQLGTTTATSPLVQVSVPSSPYIGGVYADLNGDGLLDYVSGYGGLAIYLRNANGTYASPTLINVPTAFFSDHQFVIADVNGDGFPDIFIGDPTTTIGYLNDGTGHFTPINVSTSLSGRFNGVAVGDFNGDGIPDLLYVQTSDGNGNTLVFPSLGNGDGTFAPPSSAGQMIAPSSGANNNANTILAADLNGDGFCDAVVYNDSYPGTLGVLIAPAPSGIGPNYGGTLYTYSVPASPTFADLNNDGYPDLVYGTGTGPYSMQGTATGQFAQPASLASVTGATGNIGVADFDGDGNQDVVAEYATSDANYDSVLYQELLPGNGAGGLVAANATKTLVLGSLSSGSTGLGYNGSTVVDFNGDGIPDLIGYGEVPEVFLTQRAVSSTLTNIRPLGQFNGIASVTAVYVGDSNYPAVSSSTLYLPTSQAASTTTLTSTPSSNVGVYYLLTLTAKVAGVNAGNYKATGTVAFYFGTNGSPFNDCSAVALDATGTAVCTYSDYSETSAVGTQTYKAVYSGANAFTTSTGNLSVSVTKQPLFVSWSNPAQIPYGTTLSGTQLNAMAYYQDPAVNDTNQTPGVTAVFSPAAGTVLPVGTSNLSVTLTPKSTYSSLVSANSKTVQIVVVKATPTITFGTIATHTSTDAPFTVSTTTNSDQTPVITVVSGPATISGNTITVNGAGTVQLSATTASDTNYNSATQTASFTVTAGTPTVTFGTIAAHTYGDAPFTVSATSNSGQTPTVVVTSGTATISGNTVTITGAGTVVLTATTPATANYNAGSQTATITVAKGTATITFGTIAAHTFGDAAFTVTATGPSGTTSVIAVTSGPATISSGTVTLTGSGTVVLTATTAATTNYNAGSQTATITVAKATPALTVATPAAIVYGTASDNVSASLTFSASATPSGTVTFAVDGGTPVLASCTSTPVTCTAALATSTLTAGAHTVVATYAGDTNYNGLTSSAATLTVNKGTPTLTTAPVSVTYGTTTATLSSSLAYAGTTAPAGVVSFSIDGGSAVAATCSRGSSPLSCTYTVNTSALSTGSHNVGTSYAGDSNYASTSASTATLTVTQQAPSLSASAPAIAYGTVTDSLSVSVVYTGSANAPSGSVSFSVDGGGALVASCSGSSSPRICTYSFPSGTLSVGNHNVSATIGSDSNYSAVTSSTVVLAVSTQAPTLTVPMASTAYGTANTTLTAQLAYAGSGAAPTGPVSFSVNGGTAVAGSCSGTGSPLTCTVSYPTAALAGGSYTITASYAASGNYSAASATGTLSVSAAPSALAMSVSQPTSGGVVLTVAIAGPSANYSSGSVTFYDGASIVCSAVALSNAGATCATPTLSTGTHSFTATYSGDANYASSNNNASPKVVTIDPSTNTSGGSTAPGASSAPVSVQLSFGSSFTLGAINLANSGSTQAFTIVPGGTCTVGTAYTAGQSCTVNVVFTNAVPGLLIGTLSLTDNTTAANIVGTATVAALGSR